MSRRQLSGIDTIITTPDPEHLMGKRQKNKKKTAHTVLSALRSAQTQAVTVYFKVVLRRKPSSAEGTKGRRTRMGINHSILSLGVSPDIDICFNFERFYGRFNGF